MEIKALCDIIRQTSYDIHCYLGVGFLEKVYENALVNRLSKCGLMIEQQCSLTVFDEDGAIIGDYFADLVINKELIIELKACSHLQKVHEAQLLNYLKVTGLKHGLLINFGSERFEIRKFVL